MLVTVLLSIWTNPHPVRGLVLSNDLISLPIAISLSSLSMGISSIVLIRFERLMWRSSERKDTVIIACGEGAHSEDISPLQRSVPPFIDLVSKDFRSARTSFCTSINMALIPFIVLELLFTL